MSDTMNNTLGEPAECETCGGTGSVDVSDRRAPEYQECHDCHGTGIQAR